MEIIGYPIEPERSSTVPLDSISRGLRLGGAAAAAAREQLYGMSDEQLAEVIDRSRRDNMTGLYNRATFEDIALEVIDEVRHGAKWRIIVTDMVNFKSAVNDKLGHGVGDDVLREAGAGLLFALRNGNKADLYGDDYEVNVSENSVLRLLNIAGRIGGDENAVFMQGRNIRDIAIARAMDVALRIMLYPPLGELIERYRINGLGVRVSTTMVKATHQDFSDILRDSDPKLNPVGVVSIILINNNLIPVLGYVPLGGIR